MSKGVKNLYEFGEFVRTKRIEVGLSLRKFCQLLEKDPSNWSKVERGKMPLAESEDSLKNIASILKLEKGSSDWQRFFDLAYLAKREIPDYVYSDKEVLSALPVFFRTASGEKPSDEELERIIKLLKNR